MRCHVSNRLQEFCLIVFILIIAFLIALISCKSSIPKPPQLSQNFAQILAEILAIIFILPQVIIQLTLRPQRRDIKSVFAGLIPLYFIIYIAAIVLLANNYFQIFFSSMPKWKNTFELFTFLSSLFLIFPYFYFLIKEYSTSENLFEIRKKKILKRINRLLKLSVSGNSKNMSADNNESIKTIEKDILDLVLELKDYILTFGKEGDNIFTYGVDTLAELIEKPYSYNNSNIDNLLIEILEIIGEVGVKIDSDASKNTLNVRLSKTGEFILSSNQPVNRINLLVTRIILEIEKISTQGAIICSRETIREAISLIHHVSLIGLRAKPPVLLEYHLVAENFKRMCIFSIEQFYDNCARDVLEDLGYLVKLSIKYLPVNALPVYKICDVLTEIGTLASKKKSEVFCIQCVNRIISIIVDLKEQKIAIDINNCMASLLELIANIWINFEELDEWLYTRLRDMKKDDKIHFRKYIKPTQKILTSKSLVSKAMFSDFIDFLNEYNKSPSSATMP